jgi:prevent-host-death family protein
MESVRLFQAKSHSSALLERVANDETIEITRRSRPIVLLTPLARVRKYHLQKAVEEIKRVRTSNLLGSGLTIRQLIDEGRRF